jgi:hypothetical protein
MTSLFGACIISGSLSLYVTLVCVACSQLEKLRAAILAIRQTHVTSEQDCGVVTDHQEVNGHTHSSEELFRHMQRRLNDCIRHHQEIIRCGSNQTLFNSNSCFCFERKNEFCYIVLHFSRYIQVLEDTMNLPLCGLFLLFLSSMCFAAFSAVTVKYLP